MTTTSTNKSYKSAFVFLTTLFFLWGFITVLVDSLVPRLKDVFEMSYAKTVLVQFAFFVAFFVFSLPAGFMLSKIGYKKGIVLGLLTMALGCLLFYPAAEYRTFSVFLIGYFTLAGGITILQVAANPYVALLGSEDGASSRLNLSQAFNSLGATIAPVVGALFLLSDSVKTSEEINLLKEIGKTKYYVNEAATVQTPFIFIATFIVESLTISIELTVPIFIPEKRTLFPTLRPLTLLNFDFKIKVDPNKFLLFPTRYIVTTKAIMPIMTNIPNFQVNPDSLFIT